MINLHFIMVKRFRHKNHFIEPLDLHGIKHNDVAVEVENYIMLHGSYTENFPLKIITGNSDKMKKIVIDVLIIHNYNFSIGDYYNRGYIDVLN